MAAAQGLTARKSVDDILASGQAEGHQPSKTLGPLSITATGVGAIIGVGIFVLTGTAAANHAGPGIVPSFVPGGIARAFVGLCHAELAAMLPIAGSSYTCATPGELFAWTIGWDPILEHAMGAATVAVGRSGYMAGLLHTVGIDVPPPALAAAPGTVAKLADGGTVTGIANLPAAFIVLAMTALLVLGTKESARLNNIMVVVELAVVVAFVLIGAAFVDTANWSPFVPANTGEFGHYGASGILRGAGVVFFAFVGFDAVSTAAQEARRPQRDMPVGIIGSLVICTLLYIAVAAVLAGLVPYRELGVADPIAKGVDAMGLPWFSVLIKLGALTGLTTVILVALYGQSRIFFTMAHDGLMPRMFAHTHPRPQTPHLSQMLIGGLVAVVAALVPIHILGEMVSIGTLFAFILVCGSVVYLRRSDAEVFQPFRAPGVPWVPIFGIASCLLLMVGLPFDTWLRLLVWLAVGLAIYFFYGRSHSALRHPRPGVEPRAGRAEEARPS